MRKSTKAAVVELELPPDTIHSVTIFEEIDKLRSLLATDSTLAYKKDEFDWTPLHYAARYGFHDIVSVLMENGADANQPGQNGMNALHVACYRNQIRIAKLLKEQSVTMDYNAVDEAGNSALHYAAMSGSLKCSEFLLQNGANVNGTNAKMATPVMMAALYSQENIIDDHMLVKECDINHQDCKGETALHYAARCGLDEMVSVLLKHKADKNKSNVMEQKPIDVACDETIQDLLS